MSITDRTPAWLQDLVRELGPVVVGEIIKVGADWLTTGKPPALDASSLIDGARKVRDILPDPLPNVALDDKIDAEIERREAAMRPKPFAGIFGHAAENDPAADTEPPPTPDSAA